MIKISRIGTVAGSLRLERRRASRRQRVRIVRDGAIIYETKIDSLRRFKDDVREVTEGFECGIHLEGYEDVKEGDVLEVYEVREVERTELAASAATAAPSTSDD